jgi:hypothetical protein
MRGSAAVASPSQHAFINADLHPTCRRGSQDPMCHGRDGTGGDARARPRTAAKTNGFRTEFRTLLARDARWTGQMVLALVNGPTERKRAGGRAGAGRVISPRRGAGSYKRAPWRPTRRGVPSPRKRSGRDREGEAFPPGLFG